MLYIITLIFIILMLDKNIVFIPKNAINQKAVRLINFSDGSIYNTKIDPTDEANKKIIEIFKFKLDKNIVDINRIKGSNQYNAKIYKIETTDSEKYIIKFLDANITDNGDVDREIRANIFAFKNNFGPKIYVTEYDWVTKQGYFIQEFLKNEKLTADKIRDGGFSVAIALADLLKKIHSSSKEDLNTKTQTIFDVIDWRFEQLMKRKTINQNNVEVYDKIKKYLAEMKLVLESEYKTEYKVVHSDLHINNLLYSNGRFTAIDFNDLSIGDPFFDLVRIFHSFIETGLLTSSTEIIAFENALLERYFGRTPTDLELKKLKLIKKLDLLRTALDQQLYAYKGEDEFVYSSDAKEKEMRFAFALLEEGLKDSEIDYENFLRL